jgi:uncharacterized membrane protein (DUF4010 family)
VTLYQIFKIAPTLPTENKASDKLPTIDILPLVYLAGFIILILAASKLGQRLWGDNGLIGLTFLVSLFEIHGSIIANTNLHSNGDLSLHLLGALLPIGIAASYVSKLFLIRTLGAPVLFGVAWRWSLKIVIALVASWAAFRFVVQ